MFIKYIMQSSSTIQKNEYDFVPVWIAQMVPIRTPHNIPRHFSTPKNSILYNYLLVLPNVCRLIASILKFESPSRYLEANLREAWGVFSAVYIPLILLDSDFNDNSYNIWGL